ncbi:MAG TPA: class I SAM-dependent methyltransferase, partial [Polyangiales bacterium]
MNEEQIAHWNGVTALRWTERQRVLDRALQVFGQTALARADPRAGERVLDVGCGCGDSTLALAERVGDRGSVIGVDVSAPMLARARVRATGRTSIQLLEADASRASLPRELDLIFSRFGVMFFEDAIAAFAHLRSALRANGRLAFVCWRAFEENPWMHIPVRAVERTLPNVKRQNDDGPGPFAFADAAKLEQRLTAAGFSSIAIERFDADVILSEDSLSDAVAFVLNAGPASRLLSDATP